MDRIGIFGQRTIVYGAFFHINHLAFTERLRINYSGRFTFLKHPFRTVFLVSILTQSLTGILHPKVVISSKNELWGHNFVKIDPNILHKVSRTMRSE